MPVGTLGRIESAEVRESDGFVRVRMDYIHAGVPVQLVDFINPEHIAVQGAPGDTTSTEKGSDVPEPVRQQIPKDSRLTLEIVNDWESLITDHGDAAAMHFLKARGAVGLDLVMKAMPKYNSQQLLVLHTVNHVGARKTEVWTLEDFAPGKLIFAPFSPEVKDRMYTHLAASHMVLPKKLVPGNKVLALDGRNQGHLSHVHPSQHRAYATGSLFWCITRTQEKSEANLMQQPCEVSMPKVTVKVPGLAPIAHDPGCGTGATGQCVDKHGPGQETHPPRGLGRCGRGKGQGGREGPGSQEAQGRGEGQGEGHARASQETAHSVMRPWHRMGESAPRPRVSGPARPWHECTWHP